VFEVEFSEVAGLIGRTEPTSRQLAARARRHVREGHQRSDVSPADEGRLLDAFLAAARNGEVAVLKRLLIDNAELMTDGGGRKPSALNGDAGMVTHVKDGSIDTISIKVQKPQDRRWTRFPFQGRNAQKPRPADRQTPVDADAATTATH
jgi:hypothetical protein